MERRQSTPEEERLRGNWMQLKGRIRERWGELTDDELERLQGKREQLVGRIVERSGQIRQEVERDLDQLSREANYRFE